MKIKDINKNVLLFVILIIMILFGLYMGSADISLTELLSVENRQILYLRLARVVLALIAGAGLGVSGVTLQAVLRNPLAEPYLLGVSSGAGLGAVTAMIFGITGIYLPAAAFAGAIISMLLVYNIAKDNGRVPVQSLILSGVIVAVTFSGIIVFLSSVSSRKILHGIMWWLLGSLQVYDIRLLVVVSAVVIIGIILIYFFNRDLDAVSTGEEEAVHMGIEIDKVKIILFVLTSLITGAIVSVSGVIGFTGLIIPHMLRLIIGPRHKILIPGTFLGAGAFLIFCDTLSRCLFPPVEVPIGVMTSIVGAPVFIFLLRRANR
ncbi:MAG: iron ABC transporter permease [bacterium]|nr:iron ABC transporter permease [bacterium]